MCWSALGYNRAHSNFSNGSLLDVSRDLYKKMAAEYAVQFVQSSMVVGLGHGSTAIHAVRKIAALLHSGELRDIRCIPCSRQVAEDAQVLGIPLITFADVNAIDVTIDGADEVDPLLNVIKGGGGALTREKIVAQATRREIIVVDDSKLSPALGTNWAVPVEVVAFGWQTQQRFLEKLGAKVGMRMQGGDPFVTDQGNYILDAAFGPMDDPYSIARALDHQTGIVGQGMFLDMVHDVIVADASGIQHKQR